MLRENPAIGFPDDRFASVPSARSEAAKNDGR